MAIETTTPDKILLAIESRLIQQVPDFKRDMVFLAENIDPAPFPRSDLFAAITPGDSPFDQALWAGGGSNQLSMDLPVTVTIWQRIRSDTAGEAKQVLTNAQRGMFSRLGGQVLKALLKDYEPAEGQDLVLRDQLTPQTMEAPRRMGKPHENYYAMSIVFTAKFDWTL